MEIEAKEIKSVSNYTELENGRNRREYRITKTLPMYHTSGPKQQPMPRGLHIHLTQEERDMINLRSKESCSPISVKIDGTNDNNFLSVWNQVT